MAVGAADVAAVDLADQSGEAAALASEFGDVAAFSQYVVEVEHHKIGLAAVAALAGRERGPDHTHISLLGREQLRIRIDESIVETPGWRPLSCSAAVAVHAGDLAVGDLRSDSPHRAAASYQSPDIPALAGEVVELEESYVGLPAVGAWVRRQVPLDVCASVPPTLSSCLPYLLTVPLAALTEVLSKARLAPVLATPSGMAAEAFDGLHAATARTGLASSAVDRQSHPAEAAVPDSSLNVANPNADRGDRDFEFDGNPPDRPPCRP